MTEQLLDYLEVETSANPTASVIWLHGLGADGHDFESIVPELKLSPETALRFIFPHAPEIPVTVNDGFVMRAWYDITDRAIDQRDDRPGMESSRRHVERLIKNENARGIPTGRIFLAGFSQGGAVALYAGLRYPEKLAGILALSTYLMFADALVAERHEANRGTRIFMAHGQADPVVPFQAGKRGFGQLQDAGHLVLWNEYPMPHAVCLEEIIAVGEWLQSSLT